MVHLCARQRPHVGLKLFEDCFWVASTSTVVGRIWWQLTSRKGWVNGETIMCSKCCPCPPCALVGWVHDGHVSGSGNIFAFGAGWVGHAMMQIGHRYHQCTLNIKQRNITVPLSLALESRVNPLKMVDWLVVSPACSFPPLDILRSLKPKSTWRSTVDVKKWPSQWWMQLFRHCWAWIKGLVAELVCSGIVNSFLILLTSLFVHFYAIWCCSKLANMRYVLCVCIYIYILVQVLVENDYPSGNLILQSKNTQFNEAVEMSPFLSDCHRFRCWLCWLYWLYFWWVRQHRPEAPGSYASLCIQKSHKQRLTMVHLCARQRPHVGLKLFEDCFWVAATSTVVGRIWWQLTSRKGWVNGETIMCSKCCPCPPCALVGWVHDGHVSGSGNIFAFGAGWVGHAMMQIGHRYHQCILNIKQRNITVPLSLTLESRVNPLKMVDWLVVASGRTRRLVISCVFCVKWVRWGVRGGWVAGWAAGWVAGWVGGWVGGMLTFIGLAHLRDATLLHVLFNLLRDATLLHVLLNLHNYVMLRYCTFSSICHNYVMLRSLGWVGGWVGGGDVNVHWTCTQKWRLWWGQRWIHLCDVVVSNMCGNVISKLVHHWSCWKSWQSWWKTTTPTTAKRVEKRRFDAETL